MDHTASSSAPANLSLLQLLALGFMPARLVDRKYLYQKCLNIFKTSYLRRDDFELEHDNEAEVLVSSIEAAAGTARGAGLGRLGRLEPEEEQFEAGLKLASASTGTRGRTS